MSVIKKEVCPKCKGRGLIINENNKVDICECTKIPNQVILRKLNIPKRYWSIVDRIDKADLLHNIKNNDDEEDTYVNAYLNVLSYVENFKGFEEEGRGLMFMGPPGVGKTYLSVFTLLYLYEKHKKIGLFYDTRGFVFDLKTLIGKDRISGAEDYNRLLHRAINTPLLVLDDLGSETLTDYTKDIITYIIAVRYNNLKPIIITTNLDIGPKFKTSFIKDISSNQNNINIMQKIDSQRTLSLAKENEAELYRKAKSRKLSEVPDDMKFSLNMRLGDSIISRLAEICRVVYISGEDMRYKK